VEDYTMYLIKKK